jgi:hypothetical protein
MYSCNCLQAHINKESINIQLLKCKAHWDNAINQEWNSVGGEGKTYFYQVK